MTKKGIGYLVFAPVALLIAGFIFILTQTGTETATVFKNEKASNDGHSSTPGPNVSNRSQPPTATTRQSRPAPSSEPAAPSPAAVQTGEETPIIGQFMRVREIRESSDDGQGAIRNMKFVFRPGIMPHMLFENNNQVILEYEQLHRNMVGSGAKTAFFFYKVIQQDTNGDGTLSRGDRFNVAISRPDGGNYRVLAFNVDEVVGYEDLPMQNAIRLKVKLHGKTIERTYSLEGM